MTRCNDVHILKEGFQARGPQGTAAAQGHGTDVLSLSSQVGADAIFSQFCKARSIKEGSIVAKHIRTIFNAGWEESRLETSELIKHTTNELFMANGFLRSLLATFIIIGILGTLFGLADGLSHLSPPEQNSQLVTPELMEGLKQLLKGLKSAFAPSIWGVSFTIGGVLLFNAFIQFAAAPARNTLEVMTLNIWVPQLYPSVSQKMVETLQLSQKQMERSFQAAQKVANVAETIQGGVTELDESLRSANGALSTLVQTTAGIDRFADKFIEGVGKLTPFQDELRRLYERMVDDSKTFQATVTNSNARAEEIQQKARALLEGQYSQLQAVLNGLKSYESAYLTQRHEIDAKIQRVLEAAQKAFSNLGERNSELVRAVGEPLRTELVTKLGDVENTLRVQLKAIKDTFGNFKVPFDDAANQIEGVLTTVVKRTDALTDELKREFQQQNRTYYDHLEQLSTFNKQIPALFDQLKTASEDHDKGSSSLKDAMGSLVNGVSKLDQSIGILSQTINLPEQNGEQISTVQAGSILLQLFKDNEVQRRQLKTLTDEVYELRRSMEGNRRLNAQTYTGMGVAPPPGSSSSGGRVTPQQQTNGPSRETQKLHSTAQEGHSKTKEQGAMKPPPQPPPAQTPSTQQDTQKPSDIDGQAVIPQAAPPAPAEAQRSPQSSSVKPMQVNVFSAYTDQIDNKWESGISLSHVVGKLRFWRK